jgi:predicted 2-oxoglutarate/Fe(II)-dependent dioxygenase YbiX
VTAIYYLNDEFEGGEIVFDRQQLTVKPRRGLLLAFRSDAAHAHEVLPVRRGIRYTLVIWFTPQERFAIAACRGSALPGPLPATHHP